MWRYPVIALVFLFAFLWAAGCGSNQSGNLQPYRIGAIFSVSGPGAPIGTPERDTALMLQDAINKQGGINGHPLEIVLMDDGSEETKAVLAAKKLVEQDKVLAVIGPSLSGPTLAIIPALEKAGVPLVSCAAGNQITVPTKHWVFKTAQSDILAVARLVDYMKANKLDSAGLICDSNAFGRSGQEQLEKQLPAAGIKVVAVQSFGKGDTDMTAQLTRIKAQNPAAVICWGTNPGPAIITKNMQGLGMKCPLLQSHGIADPEYLKQSGAAAEGVVFPAGRINIWQQLPKTDPQYSVLEDFDKQFQAAYQRPPIHFGAHAWDAVQLLKAALEKVGDDRAKLRDALESTKDFVGAGGIYNFSPEDHNGMTKEAFAMIKVVNGRWQLLP